jgi:hypothetical protein
MEGENAKNKRRKITLSQKNDILEASTTGKTLNELFYTPKNIGEK